MPPVPCDGLTVPYFLAEDTLVRRFQDRSPSLGRARAKVSHLAHIILSQQVFAKGIGELTVHQGSVPFMEEKVEFLEATYGASVARQGKDTCKFVLKESSEVGKVGNQRAVTVDFGSRLGYAIPPFCCGRWFRGATSRLVVLWTRSLSP